MTMSVSAASRSAASTRFARLVGQPLDLDDWMTGLRAGLFHKGGEVLLHDMI